MVKLNGWLLELAATIVAELENKNYFIILNSDEGNIIWRKINNDCHVLMMTEILDDSIILHTSSHQDKFWYADPRFPKCLFEKL